MSNGAVAGIPAANALKGVLLVVAATLCFAMTDALGKQLFDAYSVPFVMAVRYGLNVVLLLAFLWPRHRSAIWKTNRTFLVILRGMVLAAASLTMGLALKRIPLGEATAIIYLAPFLVMIAAIPLLGERVSLWGWLGAIVGFSGVLVIARPGSGLDPIGVGLALANAALGMTYHLLTRYLSRTETTMALVFHTGLVGLLIFLVLAAGNLPTTMPPADDIALLVGVGVFASAGHFLFTMAYREAPASLIAPVNYVHLVWAGVLGWLIFAHVPDRAAIFGMALVALSGAGVALRAHVEKKRALRIPAPVA